MPDHVRFLAAPEPKAKSADSFLSEWKEWTANSIERLSLAQDKFLTVKGLGETPKPARVRYPSLDFPFTR